MQNLKQEKLYKQVFYQIRQYILENDLKAGDKLPTEAIMCDMLGVSRNVLREAIKALELIGIVNSKPGVGIVVQEFTMDFFYQNVFFNLIVNDKELIDEILDIRKKLELGYMKQAFDSITENEINELENIIKSDSKTPFEDRDRDFHMTMFGNLKNRTLSSILDSAWYMDRRINGLYAITESHEELIKNHNDIIMALKEKDYKKFKNAMDYHFSSGIYYSKGIYRDK